MLWEAERLPTRHVALDVPSPGVTHTERDELVKRAWESLARRGLARGNKASNDVVDLLNLFVQPKVSIDLWVWADRQISGLAVSTGNQALLGVVDGDEVWLIPAADTSLPESAVSVAGDLGAGVGQSVSLPHEVLVAADERARGDAKAMVTELEDRGVELWQAQELAGMMMGMGTRGQFGAQRHGRDGQITRARRVIAFYDNDAGRYLFQVQPGSDGRNWATVTPADNSLLAGRVWELLSEV
ncbi:ESX secretion-associated protein EspG [Prauserella sp. ASG 168]|uniref:ESX secretion-associated protein EspG n=2 Tax=Prauserella cavernicola TaxID=2800127 RepID=A0A934V253_9PSEU|nr:ESX secretion-associated protein EspG [Prauserella cavernicola]